MSASRSPLGEALAEIDSVQRRCAEIRERLRYVEQELVETHVEGRDRAGAVTVVVSGDGRVFDVRVADRWRSSVTSSGLSRAVVAAFGNACERAADQQASAHGAAGLAGAVAQLTEARAHDAGPSDAAAPRWRSA